MKKTMTLFGAASVLALSACAGGEADADAVEVEAPAAEEAGEAMESMEAELTDEVAAEGSGAAETDDDDTMDETNNPIRPSQ